MIEIEAKCGCLFQVSVIKLIFVPGSRDVETRIKKICKKHTKEIEKEIARY